MELFKKSSVFFILKKNSFVIGVAKTF